VPKQNALELKCGVITASMIAGANTVVVMTIYINTEWNGTLRKHGTVLYTPFTASKAAR